MRRIIERSVPWPAVNRLLSLLSGLSPNSGASTAEREPMDTEVRSVDGTNTVFQYGRPVPSFETWRRDNEVREYRDLNGAWKFRFEADGEDIEEGEPEEARYAPDYDDSGWREVDVPLPWDLYDTPSFDTYDGSAYGEGTAFRDGHAWYRKRIRLDRSWAGKYVKLNFLAAFYRARVYVNGEFVAEHEGGHTPFSLDVGDRLRGGENVVAVRVYRRPRWDDYAADDPTPIADDLQVPPNPVDWWPYAGLTRDVYLEATDQVTVSKLLIDSADREVTVRAVLYNRGSRGATRSIEFSPGEGTGGETVGERVEIDPGETRVVGATLGIPEAEWWTPDSPTTYEASVTLRRTDADADDGPSVRDRLSSRYGMRTVEVDDGKVLVNGERVFLKGANWHEETGTRGRSMTREEYDRHLRRIHDLNGNFVRNSHYNRHPYVYERTDESGLFVLDEVENMWLSADQQRLQTQYGLSRALVTTMVWNQYNRPSVIMWCLQNESEIWGDRRAYRRWLRDMREAVEAVDPRQSRPITWASESTEDHAYDLADVLGVNEYFGYFYRTDDDLGPALDSMHDRYPEKPILVTENGTWSRPGDRNADRADPDSPGTDAWQAEKFRRHWEQVVAEPRGEYVCGYAFWLLKDYKEDLDYNRSTYNGISTMGMLDFGDPDPTPSRLFDAVRDAYGRHSPE